MKEIKSKLLNQLNPQRTWSKVVTTGAPIRNLTTAINIAAITRNTENRKRRELIVTIKNKDQEDITARRSPEVILKVL